MNADHAVLLNVHTVGRAIAPADDIVSAAQAGSPEAFQKLHALYSRRSIEPSSLLPKILKMQRMRYRTPFCEPIWQSKHLQEDPISTPG